MTGGDRPRPETGWLPAEVTSFVGRRREVAEVKRLLSTSRLVTLTGVGGIGKTRLALRVAAETRRGYPDGAWQVDLGVVADGALVGYALADTFDLRDQTGRPPVAVLTDHLRDRRLLLVLDGCEHLLDACATLVAELLPAAGGLRVLCTSRQRLGVAGERVFTVPPLPVPDPAQPPPGAGARYAALTLFAERAAAAAPGFALTADDQATVARICDDLDGLPLAIELAAAQLRMLSIGQVEAGLADRFRLLAIRHASPARHRTLEATFDWSYALCSSAERALWRGLAAFADGFDEAAARYVCGAEVARPGVIRGLVDKSVLSLGDPDRYYLLDTVREYGLSRLRKAGEGLEAALGRRHRDYFLRVARRAEADWFGADQEQVYHRVHVEHGNFRAALEFCATTPGEADLGLALAATLWFLWTDCGHLAEGQHWLESGLALATPAADSRRKAQWALAAIAVAQGETKRADELAGRCHDEAVRAGDRTLVAGSLQVMATAALWSDEPERAWALFSDAAAAYATIGEPTSNVLMNRAELAMTLAILGDLDGAGEMAQRVREECGERGERWALAWALHVLAVVAATRGDLAEAVGFARDCLRTHQIFHNVTGLALVVELLATLDGTGRRTAVLHGVADQMWRVLGRRLFGSEYLEASHRAAEARARRALGDDGYAEAFRTGAAMALDDALGYALAGEPAPRRAPGDEAVPHVPDALSPREREVAELIADGLSNRQVADRLVTSQRTAETHVQNILRKMGFTRRSQIASWVAERARDAGEGQPPV